MNHAFSQKRAESITTGILCCLAIFDTALMFAIETGCPPELLQVIVITIAATFTALLTAICSLMLQDQNYLSKGSRFEYPTLP